MAQLFALTTASNVSCWVDVAIHVTRMWQAVDTENFERRITGYIWAASRSRAAQSRDNMAIFRESLNMNDALRFKKYSVIHVYRHIHLWPLFPGYLSYISHNHTQPPYCTYRWTTFTVDDASLCDDSATMWWAMLCADWWHILHSWMLCSLSWFS